MIHSSFSLYLLFTEDFRIRYQCYILYTFTKNEYLDTIKITVYDHLPSELTFTIRKEAVATTNQYGVNFMVSSIYSTQSLDLMIHAVPYVE